MPSDTSRTRPAAAPPPTGRPAALTREQVLVAALGIIDQDGVEANGLLFSGDHVLPHITPSISFEPAPGALALDDYLRSLRAVRALPDARMLPAHGPVQSGTHERVDVLLAHHDQRLVASAGALTDDATTAYEAARLLPWTRHERRFDELQPFHQMLAVIETAAHLDVLAVRGELSSGEQDGVVHFRARERV